MSNPLPQAALRQTLGVLAVTALLIPHFPYVFRASLALCVFVAFRILLGKSDVPTGWHLELSPTRPAVGYARFIGWAGLAAVLILLAALENRQPHYFSHDDNHSQYLPVLVLALRQFFSTGILPVWNAYQDFGMPLIAGGYALTYPPLYLAYGVARLMGNVYYLLEALAWMHFAAGYVLMWLALRRLGVRPSLAASFSFAYVFAGAHLALGSSWFNVTLLVTFFPALLLSLVSLLGQPRASLRWIIGSGFAGGFFFHTAHAQFWIYGMMLWGVGVLWLLATAPSRDRLPALLAACAAGLITLALAMPLLWLQYQLQSDLGSGEWAGGPWRMLNNMMLPATMLKVKYNDYMPGPAHFFGGVPVLATMFFLVFSICTLARRGMRREEWRATVFMLLAVTAFTWMLGNRAPLWGMMRDIPPFDKFTASFKLMTLVALFASAAGAQLTEAFAARFAHRWLAPCIALTLTLLSAYGAFHNTPRYRFADAPYPALPALLEQMQTADGSWTKPDACRVWYVGGDRGHWPGFTYSLSNNYASPYGIFSANRYDQRVTRTYSATFANNLARKHLDVFLREYGICFVSRPNPGMKTFYVGNMYERSNISQSLEDMAFPVNRIIPVPPFTYYDVRTRDTKPLAYFSADSRALSLQVRADGVQITAGDAVAQDREIVANFHYRSWFRAFAENGAEIKVTYDNYLRTRVQLPAGAQSVLLRYAPPWHEGGGVALLLLIAAGACVQCYRLVIRRQAGSSA